MDNKETNTNETNEVVTPTENSSIENSDVQTEEVKTNEVRIINNEIELNIEEPKNEEVVEEENVEVKVEKKRLIPFIRNDDLFLLIVAIVLVLAAMNLSNIYEFISKKKFKLDPTPIVSPTDPNEENEGAENDTTEYTLNCSKKNSENNYAFDYVYTINYKGTAYQMTYEIKSIDLSLIEDENEYNEKLGMLNEFSNNSFQYTENASNINGSLITLNDDGTFTQTIDLKLAKKEDINKVEEVMFYEVNDSIDMIKTKFQNKGYTCK